MCFICDTENKVFDIKTLYSVQTLSENFKENKKASLQPIFIDMKKTTTLILRPMQIEYLLQHLPPNCSVKARASDLDYIIKAAEQERNKQK